MRKIVVSTFVSLDGVMEAPETWSLKFQSPDTAEAAFELVRRSEALLLGRVTYEGFAQAWPSRQDPMGFADKMNTMPKHVVSTTLRAPEWNNTHVLAGDPADEVRALKEQAGGDLLVYGSATLTRTLLEYDLVDELLLLVSPIIVGSGRRLFPDGTNPKTLRLADATALGGGMTALTLTPAAVPAREPATV